MLITLVKVFNMNKLLLLSLEDYALTVLYFKDVLFNMFTREVCFFWESQAFSYICDMTGSFNIYYNWKRDYAEAQSPNH